MRHTTIDLTRLALIMALSLLMAGASVDANTRDDTTPKVNLNTATAVELAYLPGVGPATAERIIKYRERRPFKRIHHLMRVKGIGRKTVKNIAPYAQVSGPTTATKKIRLGKE